MEAPLHTSNNTSNPHRHINSPVARLPPGWPDIGGILQSRWVWRKQVTCLGCWQRAEKQEAECVFFGLTFCRQVTDTTEASGSIWKVEICPGWACLCSSWTPPNSHGILMFSFLPLTFHIKDCLDACGERGLGRRESRIILGLIVRDGGPLHSNVLFDEKEKNSCAHSTTGTIPHHMKLGILFSAQLCHTFCRRQ